MHKLLLAFAASVAAVPIVAQSVQPPVSQAAEQAPFVRAEAEAVVKQLATLLEENFVFPDEAQAYASKLRSRHAAGAYANFADATVFADALTADLQAVHSDRHLRISPPRKASAGAEVKPARQGPQ